MTQPPPFVPPPPSLPEREEDRFKGSKMICKDVVVPLQYSFCSCGFGHKCIHLEQMKICLDRQGYIPAVSGCEKVHTWKEFVHSTIGPKIEPTLKNILAYRFYLYSKVSQPKNFYQVFCSERRSCTNISCRKIHENPLTPEQIDLVIEIGQC